jgi:hypothetical protein
MGLSPPCRRDSLFLRASLTVSTRVLLEGGE